MFTQGKSIQRTLLLSLLGVLWLLAAGWLALSTHVHQRDHLDEIDHRARDTIQLLAGHNTAGVTLEDSLRAMAQAASILSLNDGIDYHISTVPATLVLGRTDLPMPPPDAMISGQSVAFTHDSIQDQKQDHEHPLRITSAQFPSAASPAHTIHIRIAIDEHDFLSHSQAYIRHSLGSALLLSLLFSSAITLTVIHSLRPLRKLVEDVRNIDAGNLQQTPLRDSPAEVRYLATTLNTLLGNVQARVQRERQFINDAAHQLRTPSAGILNQAQLALAEKDDEARQLRLSKIVEAAEHNAQLIAQLLALARASDTHQTGATVFDLAALTRRVTRAWVVRATDANIDLGYEGEETCFHAGHPALIEEALDNLIDNAIRHSGGTEITVSLTHADNASNAAVLEVRDNGAGVRTGELPQMFERFWSGNQATAGCGIGLPIVAQLVEYHQGKVEAHVPAGGGLAIQITLPLVQDAQGSPNPSKPS